MAGSGRVRADAGFTSGEGVAGAVQLFVIGVVVLAEGAEGVFGVPAVDGEVGAGNVGVAQQLGAAIRGRGAEELRPRAFAAVRGFKRGDVFLGYVELPETTNMMSLNSW